MDTWGEAIFAVSDPKDKQTVLKVNPTQGKHRAADRGRQDEVMGQFDEMSMKSPAVKPDSVLHQNYQYLVDNIERVYNQVENLEQRLMVILTDAEPESRDSVGYGGNTPLSENLAMLCRRTQDLSDRLSYLTARIDL